MIIILTTQRSLSCFFRKNLLLSEHLGTSWNILDTLGHSWTLSPNFKKSLIVQQPFLRVYMFYYW